MPYARVGGIDLYFEAHGTGPRVLVIAHGALGSVGFADTFGLKASALAARGLRVVAYDARGHGRSGYATSAKDYDKTALAGELLGLLDALDLKRVCLCGTSMGATSALLLAQAHPERVDRLVLRSPPPFGADMIPVRRALNAIALSYQVLGVPLTARLAALRPGPGGAHRMRTLIGAQRRASIVPALRGFPAEPLGMDLLHSVKAPTLVLTQPADALHPLRSGEILHELMPEADLCVAPTATFWHECVEDTADVIAAFVDGRDSFTARFAAARACTFKARKTGAEMSSSTDAARPRLD
jgi:pimeloyl-ACP methyl ester carboxylesterase